MGYKSTRISAATVASANRYVTSVAMKVGAYTLANTTPGGASPSARRVTCTRTVVGGADTPGTIVVVGKNLAGQAITETLTPGAHTILVTGTQWFASITSVTGAGWATATGDDTIVVGMAAENVVVEGSGFLKSVYVAVTAAGAVTLADASGTILNMVASVPVGLYTFELDFTGYLRCDTAAASDVFVISTPSMPTSYAS